MEDPEGIEKLLTLGVEEPLKVARAIEKSDSFAELLRRWKIFAQNLGVQEPSLLELERRVNTEAILLRQVPREVLKLWKAENGTNATLQALYNALNESGLQDITEQIRKCFGSAECSDNKQARLVVQGELRTLDQLFSTCSQNEALQAIRNEVKNIPQDEFIHVIKQELYMFDSPLYYIERTLAYKSELSKLMLLDELAEEHIFLIKGISVALLAQIIGFKPIDYSGNQLDGISVRYIVLEHDGDYNKLCALTANPIHVIQYKNSSFFWLKSSKGINFIRSYICSNSYETVSEEEMVTKILRKNTPLALSIADSPGMGKTLILKQLAFTVKRANENAIVLFIVLHEFLQQIEKIDSCASAIKSLVSYASTKGIAEAVLREMFSCRLHVIYLFLDGYDEILDDKLELADSFLKNSTALPNIKIIVTTRPHLMSRLENLFNHLSYEILPFNESNQVAFLTKYWVHKHVAREGEMLDKFARQCLKMLAKQMTDDEKSIAGIPLQCMILAEVYAKDAKRASVLDTFRDESVKTVTFFEMFKNLVSLKLNRVPFSLREKYINAHIFSSVSLLFPEWESKFEPILNVFGEIEQNTLYSIGLIEKSFNGIPRYVHRTFAEYIIAEFLVNKLTFHPINLTFLFGELLGKNGSNRRESEFGLVWYETKYPVVSYFVDMHLQHKKMDDKALHEGIKLANIQVEDVCIAAKVSCKHKLEYCFELCASILQCLNIRSNEALKEIYFKDLPIVATAWPKNVSFVKKVLAFTKVGLGLDLHYHVHQDKINKYFRTPLHLALVNWDYNIVSFLLHEYGQEVTKIKCLMQVLVVSTSTEKTSTIEEKLSTIDWLVQLNPDWLKETVQEWRAIMSNAIHIRLLQRLIQHGEDINAYSEEWGTILHGAGGGSKQNHREVVRWALSNGFKIINHKNKYGRTALMENIFDLKVLDDDVLQMLLDAGADINALDQDENSSLYYAIRYSNCLSFVKKLVDSGANVCHTNRAKDTIAHIVIRFVNCTDLALLLLELFHTKGFKGFNRKNSDKLTPLKLAEKMGRKDEKLIEYLIEKESSRSSLICFRP